MNIASPDNYMSLALNLAEKGRLTVSPNPMVGCVIVRDNTIVGKGFHQKTGCSHAEIFALEEAGHLSMGAAMYVTLEPCSHHGKTPPCVDAVIKAGLKEIYIACLDPNPLVSGQGIEKLRAAGIMVHVGIKEKEAKKLNEIFFHYMQYRSPFVIAKWVMSLDGKTITSPYDDRRISGAASLQKTHELRQIADAILIGANTAVCDDPLLTVRLSSLESSEIKHPKRIILSTKGDLPLHLKLLNDERAVSHTIVAATSLISPIDKIKLAEKNIETLILPHDENHQVDLLALLQVLGEKNITSLLVEGGMSVHESFFHNKLVNRIYAHIAPVLIGRLKNKKIISPIHMEQVEDNYHFSADF
jgi:diaminohydroxyphosphoribosylaminopyrimidine deaminase/5-amino-6-(5-phosphoribosylamino)uracil reductase